MAQRICSVDGCEAPLGKHSAKGMCIHHYSASRPPCVIDGCNKPQQARGWCAMHYGRYRQTGDPLVTVLSTRPEKMCTIDGCKKPSKAREMCNMHYTRWKTTGDPLKTVSGLVRRPVNEERPCMKCGEAIPAGARACPTCAKVRRGAQYERDRNSVLARLREWHLANPDRVAANKAKYRARNADLIRERRLAPTAVAKQRERSRRHYEANRAEYIARAVADGRRAQAARRARRRNLVVARISEESLAQRMVVTWAGMCWICRVAPWSHVDHVKPLSKGGAHILANLRPACAACNMRKHARWPFERSMVA